MKKNGVVHMVSNMCERELASYQAALCVVKVLVCLDGNIKFWDRVMSGPGFAPCLWGCLRWLLL